MWGGNRENFFRINGLCRGALGGRTHLLQFQWIIKMGKDVRCISSPKVSFKEDARTAIRSGDLQANF